MELQKRLEQGRAEYAYKCVMKGSELSKPEEYKSYVKKLPMLIKNNGTGAAVAFIFSKAKGKDNNAYGLIYQQISKWIRDKNSVPDFERNELIKQLIEINSTEYRLITVEILALCKWLGRFAEGLILKD